MSNKVIVVDDLMGMGKTSWAIQYMNEAPRSQKFMYISPLLPELDRIIANTKRSFKQPEVKKTKLNHLKMLLRDGENIVTTHSLFHRADEELMDLIKSQNYTLIMDEVHQVVESVSLNKVDMDTLLDRYVSIDENGLVTWIQADDYDGAFTEIKEYAYNGSLYYLNNELFIWTFSANIFKAFKECYILTYMFSDQLQRAYFDLHDVEYEFKSIEKVGDRYYLTDYVKRSKSHLKPLINIYEGDLNNIGADRNALSVTYQSKLLNKPALLTVIKKAIYNYFNNVVKGKSAENMWTCLKQDDKKRLVWTKLAGNGYKKGWVASSTKATNDYRHKKNLAYIYNKFVNYPQKVFFNKQGVEINEDLYALSEMVQWIWRSQIREGKPINLYIPSSRMRAILIAWLNDEI